VKKKGVTNADNLERERERERERFDAFLVAFGGIFSIFSYNQLASLLIELRKV
jgi:hypothetical protein